MAPVDPEPAEQHHVLGGVGADGLADESRASSRNRVVCSPVPEDSVWVLA